MTAGGVKHLRQVEYLQMRRLSLTNREVQNLLNFEFKRQLCQSGDEKQMELNRMWKWCLDVTWTALDQGNQDHRQGFRN